MILLKMLAVFLENTFHRSCTGKKVLSQWVPKLSLTTTLGYDNPGAGNDSEDHSLEKLSEPDVTSILHRISDHLPCKKTRNISFFAWATAIAQIAPTSGSVLLYWPSSISPPGAWDLVNLHPRNLTGQHTEIGMPPTWNCISQAPRDASQMTLHGSPIAQNEQVVLARAYLQATGKLKESTSRIRMQSGKRRSLVLRRASHLK